MMRHWHWRRWRWQGYRLPADLRTKLADAGMVVTLSRRCDRCDDHIQVRVERRYT